MADLDRLKQALVAADAAGDVDGAKALAAAIREQMTQPAPSKPPKSDSRPAGLSDVIASGMTFGLTNDMAGLANAAGPAARFIGSSIGIPGVDYKPGEVSDAYSQGRNSAVRKLDAYREANPWTAFGGDVVGGFANPVSAVGVAAPGASMLTKAATGAATGAGMGAAYGFGNTEGELADRGRGAVTGGLVGGAVGAAAPPIIDLGASGLRYLADQTIGRVGAANQSSVASRKVAEAMSRDNIPPQLAAARLAELGPNASLADLGTNTQALAGAISRAPGQGRADLTNFVTTRQEGVRDAANVLKGSQSQRIMSGIDRLIPDQVDQTLAKAQAQRARAGVNYENAKADPVNNLVDISPILKSLEDEIAASKGSIKSGLERVRGLLVDSGGRPEVTIDALHGAKMAIDDLMSSGDGRNSMGRVAQARIKDYQSQLLNAIETSGPAGAEYATGRGATAAAWRTQDALESGAAFMGRGEFANAKEMAASLAKMTPDDRHAFRMGAAAALKGKLADLNVRADATKRVMDIPALEDKIRTAFGDQQTFKRYIDMLKGERQMFGTYAEVTGNSRTAARHLADADLRNDPGGTAQAMVDVASNPTNLMNYLRAAGRYAGDLRERMSTPEPVRNQIAGLLMSSNSAQLGPAMQAVQLNQARRAALTRGLLGSGTTVPTGLLGGN